MANSNQVSSQASPLVQIDLQQLGAATERLSITEVAFLGYVNVRGRVDNTAFVSALEGALGGALPKANNTFVTHGDFTVLWFGPDEWLVLTPQGKELELVSTLRAAFVGLFAAVTDVTGGYTAVDINGSAARDLLRKGSMIDFHSSVFVAGQCAQTLLGKTGVVICQTTDAPNYRVIFRRSFGDYLGLWLLDASREFV